MEIMGQRSKLEHALASAAVLSADVTPQGLKHRASMPNSAGMEGPGFKVGRLVHRPGRHRAGSDSNVFLQSNDEESSFILRLSGYLDVATEGAVRQSEGEANAPEPQKVEFRGGLRPHYYHFEDKSRGPSAVMRVFNRTSRTIPRKCSRW